MRNHDTWELDRIFVIIGSIAIAFGLVAIAWMLLAGAAFAQGATFVLPGVATFVGREDTTGSHSVSVTGSWIGAVIMAAVLSTPGWILALKRWRPRTA